MANSGDYFVMSLSVLFSFSSLFLCGVENKAGLLGMKQQYVAIEWWD